MEAGVHLAARLRGAGITAERYRLLAIAAAVILVAVVGTGATVRLTGSGLGCEHWPGCTGTVSLPEKGYHSFIEFGNRIFAFVTVMLTLAAWLGTYPAGIAGRIRRLALATFVATFLQAPLGAITVHYHLNPYLVLSHFLLSLVALSFAVVVAIEATILVRGRETTAPPVVARAGAAVAGLAFAVLVVSGTLATAAGPHSGSILVRRIWSFQPAVYWHVRATAVFGVVLALLLTWLVRARARQVRGALVVLGLLVVQMAIGEVQYRTKLPWWLVLVHVTNAGLLWAAMSAFVASFWRAARRPVQRAGAPVH